MKKGIVKGRKMFSVLLFTAFVIGWTGQPLPMATVNAKTTIEVENSENTAIRYTRVMEYLDRGLVAIPKTYGEEATGMYLSWRLLGTESLAETRFDIYKNGQLLVADFDGTNYTDTTNENGEDTSAVYQVVAADTELTDSVLAANTILVNGKQVTLTMTAGNENSSYSQKNSYGYFDIPLNVPAEVTDELAGTYTYSANDCSVGDVDGDGQYEVIVKWEPSNAQDNSKTGYTGEVLLSCYELDGTELWKQPINLGKNIRAGAHYTQFMVYDFDGDGYAELIVKTAPGSKDGNGNYVSAAGDTAEITDVDNSADHRNSGGVLMSGPEYLTVFEGSTGAALYTTNYEPTYDVTSKWGDNYGNRGNRFLAAVGYFGNEDAAGNLLPSVVMCRGYYTQAYLVAYDWDGEKLTKRFYHKSESEGADSLYGQGNHNLTVSDVDNDGYDEIVYGSAVLDHDGTVLANTQLGHGDAHHVSDFNNDGEIEVFQVHESSVGYENYGGDFWMPATGEHIYGLPSSGDTGRGVMGNIDDSYAASHPEALSLGWTSSTSETFDFNGNAVAAKPSSNNRAFQNDLVYWDGDLGRELLDNSILAKYDAATGGANRFYFGKNGNIGIGSNNGSKSNMGLIVDLFGDWREEIIGRSGNSLRVLISTLNTDYKLTTLMHDSQYRLSVATENVAYNQPPHTSYYIGTASLAAEGANYLAPAYAYTKVTTPKDRVLPPTEDAPNQPETTMKVAFEVKELAQVPLPENWSWQEEYLDTVLYVGEPETAVAVYIGEDADKYNATQTAITVTREARSFPFTDVDAEGWEYAGIYYSYQRELMSGVSDTLFTPGQELTRAQFVTVLYNYAGTPEGKYEDKFTDVAEGKWYSLPIIWAAENDITSGYDGGAFGVEDDITREQFVTMLYKYAKSIGYVKESPTGELSSYEDVTLVDSWAAEPMLWATQNAIISGKPTEDGEGILLDPDGSATRAECATIMMKFDKKVRQADDIEPENDLSSLK